jgi:hypothetical protein
MEVMACCRFDLCSWAARIAGYGIFTERGIYVMGSPFINYFLSKSRVQSTIRHTKLEILQVVNHGSSGRYGGTLRL